MADVILTGFDELQDAFKAISSIPLTVSKQAVSAMGEVAKTAIKSEGEAMGVRDPESGEHILDNIALSKPKKRKDGVKAFVTFKGAATRGHGTRPSPTSTNTALRDRNAGSRRVLSSRPPWRSTEMKFQPRPTISSATG